MPERSGFGKFFFRTLLLIFIPLLIPSCLNKEKDLFIGNWQYSQIVTSGDVVYNTTRTLQLTKTTYEETYVIRREASGAISGIIGTRGNLDIGHSSLIFDLTELATCERDSVDTCTSEVAWYAEGSQYWTDNIQYFSLVVKGEFQADGTTLILTRDLNNDGDTLDDGEHVEFHRI
jgi:hypothetical protein